MSAQIIAFPSDYDSVPKLIEAAAEANLDEAIIVGWRAEGGFYLSGSSTRADAALAALKIAERMIIDSLLEAT